MQLRKRTIALVLFAALIIGFAGAYLGGTLLEANKTGKGTPLEQELNSVQKENLEKFSKVIQAYGMIKNYYLEDLEDEQLLEGAIQGMLGTLEDPYSSYMDPEMMERFTEQIEASFEGIGAEVTMENGVVTIVSPIKDSPAEAASLRPNDQIIKIDHEDIEGLDLDEAVEKIRGEKGSEVTLEIKRKGLSETFEVVIQRDTIPIETVYGDLKTVDGKKTGIIELTSFSETTADDFSAELEKLEKEGIEGLVIDVRGNPGGLLDSVGFILEHFIPKDIPYIQIEDHDGERELAYTNLDEEKDYPISVIIDEGSASASEILAIALKEIGHDVVGKTSFGKGTVQRPLPLGDGSTIKLTFRKWLSPEGNWVHETGVEPTIEVEQPDYYYTHPIQIDDPFTYDDTGERIKNVQRMLKGLGYDPKRDDGYFDKNTEEAVIAFQKDNDLTDSGKVDEETAGLIESQVIEKIRNNEDDLQMEKALSELFK